MSRALPRSVRRTWLPIPYPLGEGVRFEPDGTGGGRVTFIARERDGSGRPPGTLVSFLKLPWGR